MTYALYDIISGEIVGASTVEPGPMPGTAFVKVDVVDGGTFNPHPTLHRVDLDTLEIVDKTPDEAAHANLPKIHEVRHAVVAELSNTDHYFMSDRIVDDDKRVPWATYRQALRDLLKLSNAVDQVKAWPLRPDGTDVAALLRSRINA